MYAAILIIINQLSNALYCCIHIHNHFFTAAGKSQVQSQQASQVQHHQPRVRDGGAAKEQGQGETRLQEQVCQAWSSKHITSSETTAASSSGSSKHKRDSPTHPSPSKLTKTKKTKESKKASASDHDNSAEEQEEAPQAKPKTMLCASNCKSTEIGVGTGNCALQNESDAKFGLICALLPLLCTVPGSMTEVCSVGAVTGLCLESSSWEA
jgi:DNA mismatch repair ATPase MutL